jgi:hypothetical protein
MGVAIDVVDMGDPKVAKDVLTGLNQADSGSKVITVPSMMDDYMVRAVRRSVAPHNLWVLRIWGHESCGLQSVSAGQDVYYGSEWQAGISTDNLDALEETLAPLRPLFAASDFQVGLRWVGKVWEANPYGFVRAIQGYDV